MSFEWQTEEETNWNELPVAPEIAEQRRRWPWFLLAGLLVAGTAVFLLSRQLSQRVEQATDNIEADVTASYTVLQQTAVRHDQNLFGNLLSGREPNWVAAQQDNLASGLLFDRPGFGLAWQPGSAETAVSNTTFSPELNAAELTTLQNYSLEIGNGLTQTVQLERLDVFRLGEDRWLLSPPKPEFWSVRHRLEGQLISVRYPSRDEAIIHRLAADLEAKLVQMCAAPGITCPSDVRVRLLFSSDPESLGEATLIAALTREAQGDVLTEGQTVRLPTPTLVGLPQDEVGYQALFRGYAAQMLALAINDAAGWECCQHLPIYRAAVSRQLYELGVGSWPLADTAVSLPNEFLLMANGFVHWEAPFPGTSTEFSETPAPYVIVDFLTNELHIPPAQIAASLANAEDENFSHWLVAVAGQPWTEATLGQAFRDYVAVWQDEPFEPPQPEADLLLLCRDQTRHDLAIYQYDFLEDEPLLLELLDYRDAFFTGLPNGSGLAVVGQRDDGEVETFLLRNGARRVAVNWDGVEDITSRPPLAIPTITDANGRYLLWIVAPGFATGTFYGLTDLDACHDGDNCQVIPLGGYPIFSPDSEQMLTLTVTNPWWPEGLSNGLMLLRDSPTAVANRSPGFGASPFWLNNGQFGYITQLQNGNQQLLLADGELNDSRVVVDSETLRTSLPVESRPNSFVIYSAQPLPNNPRIIVILAADLNLGKIPGYLFWFDQAAEQISMTLPLASESGLDAPGLRFSPDGRFLLITAPETDKTSTLLLLQETSSARTVVNQLLGETSYPRHFYASWSPDGQWLAMPELGYVRLWYGGLDEQLLTFDNLSCTNVAWVDKMQ